MSIQETLDEAMAHRCDGAASAYDAVVALLESGTPASVVLNLARNNRDALEAEAHALRTPLRSK